MLQITPVQKDPGDSCARRFYPREGSLGDIVTASITIAAPQGMVKGRDGQVIIRTRKEVRRVDGSYVRFDDNAVCDSGLENQNQRGLVCSVRWLARSKKQDLQRSHH